MVPSVCSLVRLGLLRVGTRIDRLSCTPLAERIAKIVGLDALRFTQVPGVWGPFWGTLNKKAAPKSSL